MGKPLVVDCGSRSVQNVTALKNSQQLCFA